MDTQMQDATQASVYVTAEVDNNIPVIGDKRAGIHLRDRFYYEFPQSPTYAEALARSSRVAEYVNERWDKFSVAIQWNKAVNRGQDWYNAMPTITADFSFRLDETNALIVSYLGTDVMEIGWNHRADCMYTVLLPSRYVAEMQGAQRVVIPIDLGVFYNEVNSLVAYTKTLPDNSYIFSLTHKDIFNFYS